ncbi:TlpA family protein disulfide reductase [Hymenobacter sp. BT523]|uniref:TlpA family protein disulfide reductase n=1 Tax=Hymenobacter sp. BT523 TaxID=2795725 RepID=UPI0018EA7EF9|nr:TlpA disulfide reductase family protein [Hymenobacter sp. BT523]MBJ6107425.1 TlpA family protein disulfide reductase [Hymenobacter sp. BT523]
MKHKKTFWWGYAAGLVPVLALGGTFYVMFLHQPNISLAEMQLLDLNGAPVPTAQLANRAVVVNYWATWCAPCVAEFPMFEQVRQQAGPGVTFLMVSDEPAAKIRAFMRKHPYGFTFLRVRQPLPGVNVRPMTYTFDKAGALVAKESGSLSAAELKALIPAP